MEVWAEQDGGLLATNFGSPTASLHTLVVRTSRPVGFRFGNGCNGAVTGQRLRKPAERRLFDSPAGGRQHRAVIHAVGWRGGTYRKADINSRRLAESPGRSSSWNGGSRGCLGASKRFQTFFEQLGLLTEIRRIGACWRREWVATIFATVIFTSGLI